MSFKEELSAKSKEVGKGIVSYLPEESGLQKKILEACNYSVINGGKRLRPIMIESTYLHCSEDKSELTDKDRSVVYPFMAAMEMIHCSSLVHDDLPCMDNDVLRRGVPSTWAKYGEDFGTLAGDGLMLYAFETAMKSVAAPELKMKATEILARKSGIYGMVGGQSVDVELTGSRPSREQLEYIYKNKTSALIEGSFMVGAVLAGADDETVKKLEEAGTCVGMAFQIRDDILDVISTEEKLGKPIGSDESNGKTTWLTCYGLEQSERDVEAYTKRAVELVRQTGGYRFLEELLAYLIDREF